MEILKNLRKNLYIVLFLCILALFWLGSNAFASSSSVDCQKLGDLCVYWFDNIHKSAIKEHFRIWDFKIIFWNSEGVSNWCIITSPWQMLCWKNNTYNVATYDNDWIYRYVDSFKLPTSSIVVYADSNVILFHLYNEKLLKSYDIKTKEIKEIAPYEKRLFAQYYDWKFYFWSWNIGDKFAYYDLKTWKVGSVDIKVNWLNVANRYDNQFYPFKISGWVELFNQEEVFENSMYPSEVRMKWKKLYYITSNQKFCFEMVNKLSNGSKYNCLTDVVYWFDDSQDWVFELKYLNNTGLITNINTNINTENVYNIDWKSYTFNQYFFYRSREWNLIFNYGGGNEYVVGSIDNYDSSGGKCRIVYYPEVSWRVKLWCYVNDYRYVFEIKWIRLKAKEKIEKPKDDDINFDDVWANAWNFVWWLIFDTFDRFVVNFNFDKPNHFFCKPKEKNYDINTVCACSPELCVKCVEKWITHWEYEKMKKQCTVVWVEEVENEEWAIYEVDQFDGFWWYSPINSLKSCKEWSIKSFTDYYDFSGDWLSSFTTIFVWTFEMIKDYFGFFYDFVVKFVSIFKVVLFWNSEDSWMNRLKDYAFMPLSAISHEINNNNWFLPFIWWMLSFWSQTETFVKNITENSFMSSLFVDRLELFDERALMVRLISIWVFVVDLLFCSMMWFFIYFSFFKKE